MITYPQVALRNLRLQRVIDAIGANGTMVLGTPGMAKVLATVGLASPAFLPPANGRMFLSSAPLADNDSAAGGIAAEAEIRDSTGVVVVSGLTVGLQGTGANVTVDRTDFLAHQRIEIQSGMFVHG